MCVEKDEFLNKVLLAKYKLNECDDRSVEGACLCLNYLVLEMYMRYDNVQMTEDT